MSRLVSEVWLQRCQLSSHAFSVITFLTNHVLHLNKEPDWFLASNCSLRMLSVTAGLNTQQSLDSAIGLMQCTPKYSNRYNITGACHKELTAGRDVYRHCFLTSTQHGSKGSPQAKPLYPRSQLTVPNEHDVDKDKNSSSFRPSNRNCSVFQPIPW